MIDWTNIKKIDAHIHLMPSDVIEANKEYGGNFIDFGDVEDYLKIMDKYNIESAFIMPFNDPYMLSMDFNVCTVHNNLLDMCAYSARTAHPFRRNGAPFRFKLSKAQLVD